MSSSFVPKWCKQEKYLLEVCSAFCCIAAECHSEQLIQVASSLTVQATFRRGKPESNGHWTFELNVIVEIMSPIIPSVVEQQPATEHTKRVCIHSHSSYGRGGEISMMPFWGDPWPTSGHCDRLVLVRKLSRISEICYFCNVTVNFGDVASAVVFEDQNIPRFNVPMNDIFFSQSYRSVCK